MTDHWDLFLARWLDKEAADSLLTLICIHSVDTHSSLQIPTNLTILSSDLRLLPSLPPLAHRIFSSKEPLPCLQETRTPALPTRFSLHHLKLNSRRVLIHSPFPTCSQSFLLLPPPFHTALTFLLSTFLFPTAPQNEQPLPICYSHFSLFYDCSCMIRCNIH